MRKKDLEYFRNLLTERLNRLLAGAKETMVDMIEDEEENIADISDRASVESDRNFVLRIRDRERKLIVKIKKALEKIENGTFGICEICGEEISIERLKVRPVTTLCIECKKHQEIIEKTRQQ